MDNSAVGWRNVIDILEYDKSEKMAYKTGYALRGWCLFFVSGEKDVMGKLVKHLKEKMLRMWRELYVSVKGVFLRFAEGVVAIGFVQMLICGCYGAFLANFCMRGRKPRYLACETVFCLLVVLFANAFVRKEFEYVLIPTAGYWSALAGHLGEK